MVLVAVSMCIAGGAADLLVVENGLTPWPSGHGEDPPPIGSLVRLDAATGTRHLVAGGLVDPVWVVGSSDGLFGTCPPTLLRYLGPGSIARRKIRYGRTTHKLTTTPALAATRAWCVQHTLGVGDGTV